jgi:hypothetical protein
MIFRLTFSPGQTHEASCGSTRAARDHVSYLRTEEGVTGRLVAVSCNGEALCPLDFETEEGVAS